MNLRSTALALLFAILAGCGSDDHIWALPAPPAASYLPVGPQLNVAASTVTAGGWSACHTELYDATTAVITTVLATCDKPLLMLACRPVGAANYTVLAQAPRADVTFITPIDSTTVHDANGTGWYFRNDYSWGFARQGDAVSKGECDTETSGANDERLCWHTLGTDTITGGWRCGATTNLNGDQSFERLILHAD